MARRERYERRYAGEVVGVVLKTGNTIDFEIIGADGGAHAPAIAQVTEVQRRVDQLVRLEPQGDWQRVLGMLCLPAPASNDRAHSRSGRQQMSNVPRFMATKNPQHRHLSTDSFDYFEQEGRRLRRT
jgi:hypothetical protein